MKKPTQSEQISMMIRTVLRAEGEAIGCEECFELLDQVAELVEAGQSYAELHPDVKKHLEDCFCCSQEFEALLTALKTLPPVEQ